MADELRPRVAITGGTIYDVVMLADGGFAVLTGNSVELYDASLVRREIVEGKTDGQTLVALDDGRFLAHRRFGAPTLATIGGAVTRLDLGDLGSEDSYIATPGGFIIVAFKGVFVDRGGTQTTIALGGRVEYGGCEWRGGAVVAGFEGIAILAADGSEIARTDIRVGKRPVALANAFVVPDMDDVIVFDDAAHEIARIPANVSTSDSLVPFRDGVLVRTVEDDRDTTVACYAIDGTEIWSGTYPVLLADPIVVSDDRVVLAAYEGSTWILDGDGRELAKVPTSSYVDAVAAFGNGIAISVRDTFGATWWRPDSAPLELSHDSAPSVMRTLPGGRLLSTDGAALCVWSTAPDEQGTEAALTTSLPMDVPIVVNGSIVRVVGRGRFALRAKTVHGTALTIAPDAAWRAVTSPEHAATILDRLVKRTFETSLPAADSELEQLPLAATVDLQGRALFAASSLDPAVRDRAIAARRQFFVELGFALGRSGREVLAAVKARKAALVPPKPVPKPYEYLGTFTTSGDLTISDPCYLGRKSSSGFALSHKLKGHEGVWHAFVRSEKDRTAELVVIHDDGFSVYAAEPVGFIGVDSGTAGVFDKKCPKHDNNAPLEEGPFAGLGVVSSSGWGDGGYGVLAGSLNGLVAKIRIQYIGDEPEIDRSVAIATTAAKPYNVTTKFALGDTVAHVKFGTGSVTRVGGDGKIDVRFPDGIRTLIHAKK